MSRVIHFEVPADNPERALAFYATAFGWTFNKFEGPMPYWPVMTGDREAPGIDGGLMPREQPGQGPRIVVGVDSVDEAIEKIQAAGGKIVSPKAAIPGVGYAAYFTDTEGNSVGVFQGDPSAR
jgi:predicted enzyme related to lactoylglutathione lyase